MEISAGYSTTASVRLADRARDARDWKCADTPACAGTPAAGGCSAPVFEEAGLEQDKSHCKKHPPER
jgi:hypothetical protein